MWFQNQKRNLAPLGLSVVQQILHEWGLHPGSEKRLLASPLPLKQGKCSKQEVPQSALLKQRCSCVTARGLLRCETDFWIPFES